MVRLKGIKAAALASVRQRTGSKGWYRTSYFASFGRMTDAFDRASKLGTKILAALIWRVPVTKNTAEEEAKKNP
jgi:hypothetical protein